MLLPTKGVSAERALMTIGSELLEILETPRSISSLWEQYKTQQGGSGVLDHVTFDWFSLALSSLFAINLVEWSSSGFLRRADVH